MYQLMLETVRHGRSTKYILNKLKSKIKIFREYRKFLRENKNSKNDFCILTIRKNDSILESKIF